VDAEERFGQLVDAFAERGVGDGEREGGGAEAGEGGFGVCAGIVRGVGEGVGCEGADAEKGGGGPAVQKEVLDDVPRVLREGDGEGGRDREQAGFGGDGEMRQGGLGEVALDHQQQADGSGFDGLVAAERQAELVLLLRDVGHRHHGIKDMSTKGSKRYSGKAKRESADYADCAEVERGAVPSPGKPGSG